MVGVDPEELVLYVVVEVHTASCYDIIDSYELMCEAEGKIEDLERWHKESVYEVMEFRPVKR